MVKFNDNLPEDLRRKLESTIGNMPGADFARINEALQAQAEQYNHTPQAELQGYSPAMCHALRYEWNTPGSPIQFDSGLSLEQLVPSKTFTQIRTMLLAVREADGVKATTSGNFNRKFVEAMMTPLLNSEEEAHLWRYNKVLNEPDFAELHEARIVAQIAGLLVKRKGIIRVAKKHAGLLSEARAGVLFTRLFDAYFRKYNIGYRYRYGIDLNWIQHEIRFLLYPLYLKARKWMPAEQLYEAILHPMTREKLEHQLSDQTFTNTSDVIERYLVRPLDRWGLLEVQWSQDAHFPKPDKVRISPLFGQFIQFNKDAE